jgi:hypothetical protein
MGRSFDSHPLVEGYGTSCRGAPELSYCLHNGAKSVKIEREKSMTRTSRREENIERARQLATSVAVAQVEKEGSIEKPGAWYNSMVV